MLVIADTTPVLSLLKAGYLELLEKLYGCVLVPKAVYCELTENPVYAEEAAVIRTTEYLSVAVVENRKSVNILRGITGLDAGESEALILYDEQKADLLLLDEQSGRKVAKRLKVKCVGTAGILMVAYDKGYIGQTEVKKCLDLMLANHIRLGRKICNTVMAHIGLEESY